MSLAKPPGYYPRSFRKSPVRMASFPCDAQALDKIEMSPRRSLLSLSLSLSLDHPVILGRLLPQHHSDITQFASQFHTHFILINRLGTGFHCLFTFISSPSSAK